jgi:hypothetical protein
MHPEIAAFVSERGLAPELVGPLHSLFDRLTRAPGTADGVPDGYDDLGPLGIGGMGEVRRAGGVGDWCGDAFRREGPALDGQRVLPPAAAPTDAARNVRGGNWVGSARYARSAYRYRYEPGMRYGSLGFRVGYRPDPG